MKNSKTARVFHNRENGYSPPMQYNAVIRNNKFEDCGNSTQYFCHPKQKHKNKNNKVTGFKLCVLITAIYYMCLLIKSRRERETRKYWRHYGKWEIFFCASYNINKMSRVLKSKREEILHSTIPKEGLNNPLCPDFVVSPILFSRVGFSPSWAQGLPQRAFAARVPTLINGRPGQEPYLPSSVWLQKLNLGFCEGTMNSNMATKMATVASEAYLGGRAYRMSQLSCSSCHAPNLYRV